VHNEVFTKAQLLLRKPIVCVRRIN